MYRVKQKDSSDCAVASLMSIIKYYKGNIDYEKLRNMMKCNKDGVSAYDLVKTSKRIGFESYGIRCNYEDLYNIKLPCIAHVIIKGVYRHYVVIESIGSKVKINDPYFGKKTYLKDEFLKIWTNIVIVLNPISITKENTKNRLYLDIISKYKYKIIIISIMSFITIILSIIGTYYFKSLIDNLNNGKRIYILFSIILFIRVIFEYITNNITIKTDINIDKDLTINTIKNILSLKSEYFINRQKGDILSRIEKLESIKTILFKIPIILFMHINIIIICIFILINLNKTLFFISLVIVLIYFLLYVLYYKKNKLYISTINEEKGHITGIISEIIDGESSIKTQGLLNKKIDEIKINYDKYLNIKYNFNKLYNKEHIIKNLLLLLLTNYILYIGSTKMTLSNMVLFYSILIMLIDSFKNIFELEEDFTNGIVSINRLGETIKESLDYGYYSNNIDSIHIKGLFFSYKNDEYIIKNLNLSLSRGDRLLVKGGSGTGKTTLFLLIQGIYRADEGSIVIGNRDINDWNIRGIENNITYVGTNSKIFKGKLIDNIGDDINKVNDILKISNLKLDLNYIVEEDGSNLSLGERSKLILTRALYKESSIIILDELLSNIELEEEIEILKKIFDYFKDKIIIYTSHRNIDLFNKVLILKKGEDYEIN